MSEQFDSNSFLENLDKYSDLVSWARWYPDLWYDLITPETGGIRLGLDQRVFLRCTARFIGMYGVFPRGYGKTMKEVMGMVHAAIWFPDIEIAMTAQTKENASAILEDKWKELVKFYPLLQNELSVKPSFQKDSAEIFFKSGGRVDILANHNSSKGQRRKRLNVEEAALLNEKVYEEALEPIPNVPRRTIGREATINPQEMNGQIHFFTTSYFRGTDAYERNLKMFHDMVDLKGNIVLGAGWQLGLQYGRGESKSSIMKKKETLSPINFAQNYGSKWTGSIDGGLVNIKKLLSIRNIEKPDVKADGISTYVIACDVARSQSESNNKTIFAILKLVHDKNRKLENVNLVNLISLPNGLNFTKQAIAIKRLKKIYNAKVIIIDESGVGKGLKDEVLKDHIDPDTEENLGCWNTINTTDEPQGRNAEKIVYALNASGINHDIIITFMDMVESEILQLLIKNDSKTYDVNDKEYIEKFITPHIQTDLFMEEVENLKIHETDNNKKLSLRQQSRKIDDDRYSAVAYGLWYIKTFMGKPIIKNDSEFVKKMTVRKPSYFNKAKR